MPKPNRTSRHLAIALAAGCAGLAIASAAEAVDLRDWGRKFTASERFVVLAQFDNQAVLDKETQLVWERQPAVAKVLWYEALQSCAVKAIGGRSGWRLAALNELTSLYDAATGLPAGHPFTLGGSLVGAPFLFWTATISARNVDYTWTFEFKPGSLPEHQYNTKQDFRAWCVRASGPLVSY